MAGKKPEATNLDAWATDHLHRIREMQQVIRDAERDRADAQGEYKLAKQKLDFERGKLARFIEDTQPGKSDPLFKEIKTEPAQSISAPLDQDDSWKEVTLVEVLCALSENLQVKILDAQLTTMGELSEFLKHKQLTDIPGVGAKNAEKIEESLNAFWKRRAEQAAVPATTCEHPAEAVEPAPEQNPTEGFPMAIAEPLQDDKPQEPPT